MDFSLGVISAARWVTSRVSSRLQGASFEITDTNLLAPDSSDDAIKTATYQMLVQNFGDSTAHNCKVNVGFFGTRSYNNGDDDVDEEIIVDTNACWSKAGNPSSISLHSDEAEWFDVFRLVEDYSNPSAFNPDEDRYLEFPTSEGWDEKAQIQFRRRNAGATVSDTKVSRKAIHQVEWDRAYIEVTSEETNIERELDFDDVNEKLELSVLFTNDSFDDLSEKLNWEVDN